MTRDRPADADADALACDRSDGEVAFRVVLSTIAKTRRLDIILVAPDAVDIQARRELDIYLPCDLAQSHIYVLWISARCH